MPKLVTAIAVTAANRDILDFFLRLTAATQLQLQLLFIVALSLKCEKFLTSTVFSHSTPLPEKTEKYRRGCTMLTVRITLLFKRSTGLGVTVWTACFSYCWSTYIHPLWNVLFRLRPNQIWSISTYSSSTKICQSWWSQRSWAAILQETPLLNQQPHQTFSSSKLVRVIICIFCLVFFSPKKCLNLCTLIKNQLQ